MIAKAPGGGGAFQVLDAAASMRRLLQKAMTRLLAICKA
jgi:hypothetical protein